MAQIKKSVQFNLQMAEFNKGFSRMTRTKSATNLVLTPRIDSYGTHAQSCKLIPLKISPTVHVQATYMIFHTLHMHFQEASLTAYPACKLTN